MKGIEKQEELLFDLEEMLDGFDERYRVARGEYDKAIVAVKKEWSSRHAMQGRWMQNYKEYILNNYGVNTAAENERRRRVFSWRNNWLFNMFVGSDYYDSPDIQREMTDKSWDELFEYMMPCGDRIISDITLGRTFGRRSTCVKFDDYKKTSQLVQQMFLEHISEDLVHNVQVSISNRRTFMEMYNNIKAIGLDVVELSGDDLRMINEFNSCLR